MTPTRFRPYRRSLTVDVVVNIAIGVCGLVETIYSHGDLAAAIFVGGVLFGAATQTYTWRNTWRIPISAVPDVPLASTVERFERTIMQAIAHYIPNVPFLVVGVYYPVFGAVAAGGAIGVAIPQLLKLLETVHTENAHASRMLVEVLPRSLRSRASPRLYVLPGPTGMRL